ncbi:hypothetical protein [Halomonas sp. I5-271120]|uniref:hypothetical protein n=1 Tax=Halomonas sp. I5-271120 TaxID=3061632 RepID=UPI002714860C|nr:hypothetical protein [Halomonas sp. I5-271120]
MSKSPAPLWVLLGALVGIIALTVQTIASYLLIPLGFVLAKELCHRSRRLPAFSVTSAVSYIAGVFAPSAVATLKLLT